MNTTHRTMFLSHHVLFFCVGLCVIVFFDSNAYAQQVVQSAEPPGRFALSLGLEMGTYVEALGYETNDTRLEQTRSVWQTRLNLGLSYQLGHWAGARVQGQNNLGIGYVFDEGDVPLFLAQHIGLMWHFGSQIQLGTGAMAAAQWNVSSPTQSYLTLGPTFLVGWRAVALTYSPSMALGLSQEEDDAFVGMRTRGLSTGSLAHTFGLQFQWTL